MAERCVTRRRFLVEGGTTLAASTCLGCALVRVTRTPDISVPPRDDKITLSRSAIERTLDLVDKTNVVSGLMIKPEGTAEKIILFRTPDGELHALSSICTHMGCDVHYDLDVGHIVCPCHGSEYAVDGSNLKGPAKRPLKRYAVEVTEEQVIIEI